ncbi:MAG: hypothetical protein IPH57_18010 [Saprospiraceae bacterium]|nr:hypothetical protein [Saprospiraceae bacterium]
MKIIPKIEKIIWYLEKIGSEEVRYKLNSEFRPGIIQEMEGVTRLWYKKSDGSWIIRLWK